MMQICSQHKNLSLSLNPTSSMDSSISLPDASAAPPPPTPAHNRRPRVREVSSRFMSPAVSTASRRRNHSEADSSDDENNRPIENSESTPFPIGCSIPQSKGGNTQRKQRVVKLFKENNYGGGGGGGRIEQVPHPSKSCSGRIGIGVGNGGFSAATPSRPDTPTIAVSSRYRHTQQHRAGSVSGNGNSSAAEKLLKTSGMVMPMKGNSVCGDASSVCSSDDECRDSDVSCSIQSLPELCSEGDLSPTVSNRSRSVLSTRDLKLHASPFYRSISLPSHSGENLPMHSVKGSEKQTPSLSKLHGNNQSNHVKVGGLSLPPVPPCAKPATETRKAKKVSSHQEDVHSLRLMHNRYLQWRYANAKAVSAMKARQTESEKALYSLAMRISEMRDSVNRKRIELELLRRSKTLSAVLENQIPYLDEWSVLEEDYSVSITEAIQALTNASVQLPIGGDVRLDVREVGETLDSASKMMETIVSNIQRFMPKAQETDISVSELARTVGGERALIGECGDLLSKTYKSQVEECSLRGQLIQLHSGSTCHKNKITEQQATDSSISFD